MNTTKPDDVVDLSNSCTVQSLKRAVKFIDLDLV